MKFIEKRVSLASILTIGLCSCAPAGLGTTPETHPPQPGVVVSTVTPETMMTPGPSAGPTPTPAPTTTSSEPTLSPDAKLMAGTNHNVAADRYAYSAEQVQSWLKDPATAPEKLVFLTFDDGPNDNSSLAILDILKRAKVPATFFVVGKDVNSAPDTLRREIAEGHAVALHSYTHNYDKLYPGRYADADQVLTEYRKVLDTVRGVLGEDYSTTCWRYPGGHMSWKGMKAADLALRNEGVYWIDWNSMTGDAEPESRRPTTAEAMVTMATEPITQGVQVSVMLAHDSKDKPLTIEALPRIIQAYKDAGYSFGVIS